MTRPRQTFNSNHVRAILRTLAEMGSATASQLAAARGLRSNHVQAVLEQQVDAGTVAVVPRNPGKPDRAAMYRVVTPGR